MRHILFLVIALSLCLSGCENTNFGARETGAVAGGLLGAGLGAIIGHQVGETGAGIAIGSAAGAISGGLIGNQFDNTNAALTEREELLANQDQQLEENRRLIEELRRGGSDVRVTDRGVVVNLPDVLFDFGSAKLTPRAVQTTADIAATIREAAPDRRVSVEGHTDSIGSLSYNQGLSERRADSVATELERNGVANNKIRTRGFGPSRPIASNKEELGRARNRRVEIIIEN